jgi:hypothetical protein
MTIKKLLLITSLVGIIGVAVYFVLSSSQIPTENNFQEQKKDMIEATPRQVSNKEMPTAQYDLAANDNMYYVFPAIILREVSRQNVGLQPATQYEVRIENEPGLPQKGNLRGTVVISILSNSNFRFFPKVGNTGVFYTAYDPVEKWYTVTQATAYIND